MTTTDVLVYGGAVAFLGYLLGSFLTHRRWQRASEATDANWRAILNAVQAGQRIDFQLPAPSRSRRRLRKN